MTRRLVISSFCMSKDDLSRPPAPKPKRSDSKAIVDSIVRAARTLAGQGIERLSFAEIARRAGVGEASVHRYFPTRGALLAEVLRRQIQDEVEVVRRLVEQSSTLHEAVEACVRATVNFDSIEARRRRVLNQHVPTSWSSDELVESIDAVRVILESALRRFRPDLSNEEVSRRVFYGVGFQRGVIALRWLRPAWGPDIDDVIRTMTDSIIAIADAQ